MQSMHSSDGGVEGLEKGERSAFSMQTDVIQAHIGLEPFLRLLHEGAYIVDKDRRIQFWNDTAEKITGYTASTVIGSRCSDNILRHVSEDGRELCISGCPLQATLIDGKQETSSPTFIIETGSVFPRMCVRSRCEMIKVCPEHLRFSTRSMKNQLYRRT